MSANIEPVDELPLVKHSGAKGVGLYRTEFLLLNGEEMPDEGRQAEVYTKVVRGMAPHLVIVRTLDAGGDKLPVVELTMRSGDTIVVHDAGRMVPGCGRTVSA